MVALCLGLWQWYRVDTVPEWTEDQLSVLQSLWLRNLPPLPSAESNRIAYDIHAAKFGQQLFFDQRLSANGSVACATCHQPQHYFTDGLPQAVGIDKSDRNTMTVVGAAYSPWFFWDGRKDSLWSQALGPLENPKEHGSSRQAVADLIASDPAYRRQYQSVFDSIPDNHTEDGTLTTFVNAGKAIAAYERRLLPGTSRFDNYVDYLVNHTEYSPQELLNADEIAGLQLFIDKAQCINCHNGPLFSNFSFHNNGVLPFPGTVPAMGRVDAVDVVRADPFNCLGVFNKAKEKHCDELQFAKTGDTLIGAQKTPSLRTLNGTEPYMHEGQLADLKAVLRHYNKADKALVGHNETNPLNLSQRQLNQLEQFLQSLQAPIAAKPQWLQAPAKHQFGPASIDD